MIQRFSGPGAAAGRRALNGVRVQADVLNARGGLLGKRIEVVAADDESDPGKAHELVREQLGDGRVQLIVGPGSSRAFDAVKADLSQGRVPNCVAAVADRSMTETPFSFRAAPSDRDRLAAALAYLRKTRAAASGVGLLDVGDQDAQVSDGLLTELAGSHGLTYVGRAPVGGGGGSNAAGAAQQLVDQGAQAAFITGQPEQLARMASAIQAAGISGRLQLLGLDGVGDYAFPISAGEAAVAPVFAGGSQAYLTEQPEATWPAGYRDFVHRASRGYGYGSEGVEIQATPAFADCVMQWARAVRNAGTFAGVKVAGAWEQLDVAGSETALGVRESASPTNHSTVAAEGVFVYSWIKSGTAYRLKQLAGPAAG